VLSYLTNDRILKSYLSGESEINIWGVEMNIIFQGSRFFEDIFKYRIGITQLTHLNKYSIILITLSLTRSN